MLLSILTEIESQFLNNYCGFYLKTLVNERYSRIVPNCVIKKLDGCSAYFLNKMLGLFHCVWNRHGLFQSGPFNIRQFYWKKIVLFYVNTRLKNTYTNYFFIFPRGLPRTEIWLVAMCEPGKSFWYDSKLWLNTL